MGKSIRTKLEMWTSWGYFRRMHEYATAYHVASVYFLRLKGVHLVGLETSEGGVLYNVIEKSV